MYNKVSSSCKYSLDSYNEKTTLGLVTQFFPILEMKIRQVASYCGISPFKNKCFHIVLYTFYSKFKHFSNKYRFFGIL